MNDHSLNPMRDSNLVQVLGRQTSLPAGLVQIATIRKRAAAVRAACSFFCKTTPCGP